MSDPERTPEPSVLGAGCGVGPMPARADAERVWRERFAARLVERGILDEDAARDCAAAGDVDLSADPSDAADDEVSYWND